MEPDSGETPIAAGMSGEEGAALKTLVGDAAGLAEVDDLGSAAIAARAARDSLRRLVEALSVGAASVSAGEPDVPRSSVGPPTGGTINAMRARVEADLAKLKMHASSVLPGTMLLDGVPRAPGVAARRVRRRLAGVPRDIEEAEKEGAANKAEEGDLCPRLLLRARTGEDVLAVALSEDGEATGARDSSSVVVVLSSGRVEVWDRDLFSWHLGSSGQLPLRLPMDATALTSAALAEGGRLLWVMLNEPGVATRLVLFVRDDSVPRQLVVAASLTCQPAGSVPIAGPVPLPITSLVGGDWAPSGVALALASPAPIAGSADSWVHVAIWQLREDLRGMQLAIAGNAEAGEWLLERCSFEAVAQSMVSQRELVVGLWALPSSSSSSFAASLGGSSFGGGGGGDAAPLWRLAIWSRPGCCGGELQIRDGLGELLARLPVDDSVMLLVVPPQDAFSATIAAERLFATEPPPFVALAGRRPPASDGSVDDCSLSFEWLVGLIAAETKQVSDSPGELRFRPLRVAQAPAACAEVLACSRSLVGCRSVCGPTYILDWQRLRAQTLPDGWEPVAVGQSVVLLLRARGLAGSDVNAGGLLFLEPH